MIMNMQNDMRSKIFDANSNVRVAGYARVSTEKQEGNNSLKLQEEAYERDKERYGWVNMPIIKETGSGTSLKDREGVKELLRLVENGEVEGVWVIDTDRLCRPENLIDLDTIYDVFIGNDVKLVTPTRIYDLKVDNDVFIFDIEGVLAKHNRRRLLQNMNRGKLAKAKEGKNAGGSAPDGYIINHKTGKYVFDPDRVEYVRLAWDLAYNHDFTLRGLVKEFERRGIRSISEKKWSLTHFQEMFHNEEYLGKYIYGKTKTIKNRKSRKAKCIKTSSDEWIVVDDAHEPLVSIEVFYGVQEKLRWRRKRINHNTHMLTGIATCYLCSMPLHVKFSGGRIPKYVCTRKEKGCVSPWFDLNEMNNLVWSKFKVLLENPALIERLAKPLHSVEYRIKELREKQNTLQNQINKIEGKKERLLNLYLDGSYSKHELDDKKRELDNSLVSYRNEYELVSAGVRGLEDQPNDLSEIIKYMKILNYSERKLSYNQKVRIFRQFLYRVHLQENKEFELELYQKPNEDVPVNFRSFPKDVKRGIDYNQWKVNGLGTVDKEEEAIYNLANQCSGLQSFTDNSGSWSIRKYFRRSCRRSHPVPESRSEFVDVIL